MWKNTVERGRLQTAIWRVRIACWIPKATDTHLEYLLLFRWNNGCGIRLKLKLKIV